MLSKLIGKSLSLRSQPSSLEVIPFLGPLLLLAHASRLCLLFYQVQYVTIRLNSRCKNWIALQKGTVQRSFKYNFKKAAWLHSLDVAKPTQLPFHDLLRAVSLDWSRWRTSVFVMRSVYLILAMCIDIKFFSLLFPHSATKIH